MTALAAILGIALMAIGAADIAAVLFIAVTVWLACTVFFCLLFAPRIIAAIREQHADDIRHAAAASGDDQHPEWDEAVALGNSHGQTIVPIAESEAAQRIAAVIAHNEAGRADWRTAERWGRK